MQRHSFLFAVLQIFDNGRKKLLVGGRFAAVREIDVPGLGSLAFPSLQDYQPDGVFYGMPVPVPELDRDGGIQVLGQTEPVIAAILIQGGTQKTEAHPMDGNAQFVEDLTAMGNGCGGGECWVHGFTSILL